MDIDWKTLFTSPAGRIKRQTYWIGWICQFVGAIAVGFVGGLIHQYVAVAIGLLLLYPLYCLYAKRLQDMGKPGVIAALPILTGLVSQGVGLYAIAVLGIKPGFNPMAAQDFDPEKMGTLMAIGFTNLGLGLIGLGFWLVLGIANGQEGPNRFGPEPGSDEEVFE